MHPYLWIFLSLSVMLVWCWEVQRPWRSYRSLFEQAVKAVPGSSKAHCSLGLALMDSGDTEGARRELEKALEIWPHLPRAWDALGRIEMGDKHYEKAEECFRKALYIEPRMGECHNALGNLLAITGRPQEAVQQFEIYRRLGPADPEALERKIAHTRSKIASH